MKWTSLALFLILFQRPLSELKFGPAFYVLFPLCVIGFYQIHQRVTGNRTVFYCLTLGALLVCSLITLTSTFTPLEGSHHVLVVRQILNLIFFVPFLVALKHLDHTEARKIVEFSIYVTSVLLILWIASGGEYKSQRAGNPLANIFEIYTGNRLLLPQFILITFCYTFLNISFNKKIYIGYTFINLAVAYQMPGKFSFVCIIGILSTIFLIYNLNVKHIKILGFLFISIMCLLGILFNEEVLNIVNILEQVSKARASQITETYGYWKTCDHCFWLGYGIGGTTELSVGSKGNDLIAHNLVVYFLFEQGIFVFSLFVFICIIVCIQFFYVRTHNSIIMIFLLLVVVGLSMFKPLFLFSDYYLILLSTPFLLANRTGSYKWTR